LRAIPARKTSFKGSSSASDSSCANSVMIYCAIAPRPERAQADYVWRRSLLAEGMSCDRPGGPAQA
jgi:hypothetical protein